MKRIKAACICQTLHFQLKEDQPRSYAARMVQEDVKRYKESLDASRTRYRIEEETTQPDGSVIVRIIKQYNQSPVGDYLEPKQ